jgi:hypothetical protein
MVSYRAHTYNLSVNFIQIRIFLSLAFAHTYSLNVLLCSVIFYVKLLFDMSNVIYLQLWM